MVKIKNMVIFSVLFFFFLAINISFSLPQCSFAKIESTIYMTYDIPYSIYFYSPNNEKGTCIARTAAEDIYSDVSSYLPENLLVWFPFDRETETTTTFFTNSAFLSPNLTFNKNSTICNSFSGKNKEGARFNSSCYFLNANWSTYNSIMDVGNKWKTFAFWIVPLNDTFSFTIRAWASNDYRHFQLRVNNTCIEVEKHYSTTGSVWTSFCNSTLINITKNRATHITVSLNITSGGGEMKIFINGRNIKNVTNLGGGYTGGVIRSELVSFSSIIIDDLFVFNGTLTESDVRKLMNYPSISRGLVGCWKLDENSGTIANDCSGYGNHGTLYNNATWVDGKFGKAVWFDASISGCRIQVPRSESLEPQQVSVSVWVKFDNITTEQVMVNKRHANSTFLWRSYALTIKSAKPTFVLSTNENPRMWVISNITITTGVWYHIVGTYDGSKIRIYVNGVLTGETNQNGTIPYDSNDLYIGRLDGTTTYPLNGTIDEVRIYNRALSEEEVKMLYNMREGTNYEYIDGTIQASVNHTRMLFECSDYFGYQTYQSDNFSIKNVCVNVYDTSFNLINTTITIDNATSSISTNQNPVCYNYLEMPNGNVTIRAFSNIYGIETTRNMFLNVNNNTFSNLSLFFAPSLSCFVFETRNIIREPIPNALLNFYHTVNGTFRLITQEMTDNSAQTSVCLPTGIPIRIEASATKYRPANFTYTLFEWTSQPIIITLIPETINATIREDPFGIMAVFEPRSQVVSPGTTINISIIATSDATFTNVTFYLINRTLGNKETIYQETCGNTRRCDFSFNLSHETHRYDVVIIANMINGTDARTFRYETFFVTTYADTTLGPGFVEKSGLGADVWLFIWFILTTAIFGVTFKYIGIGAVGTIIFMILFGLYLGIIPLGYGLLILLFSVIVILVAG